MISGTRETTRAKGAGAAEIMARRVCHDVAGLLGALSGLLPLAPADAEAARVAGETAEALTARVRLLRAAWGGADAGMSRAAILACAPGLPGADRLRIEAEHLPASLGEAEARLCLCLMLCGAAALPRGGVMRLGADARAVWTEIAGRQAAWPDLAAAAITPGAPRDVPFFMLLASAAGAGFAVSCAGPRLTASRVAARGRAAA